MVRCEELRLLLDDYLDDALPARTRQHFVEHAGNCPDCRRGVNKAVALQQALRELPGPVLPTDLSERQFRRLWASQPAVITTPHRLGTLLQPAVAAALLAGVLLGGGLMYWSSGAGTLVPEVVAVELYDTREVRFAVNAKRDLAGVRLTLQIPAHMELVGYSGKKELVWTTDLKQGTNLLSLPLRATGEGKGEVVMLIESPSGQQTRRALLVTTRDDRTSSVSFSPVANSGLI